MRHAPVPGWPGYIAREDGKIFSQWRKIPIPGRGSRVEIDSTLMRELKPFDRKNSRKSRGRWRKPTGYQSVSLAGGGKHRVEYVHVLMLLAFVGPKPFPGAEVLHGDDNRSNNALENLRWGTHEENTEDRMTHGTVLRGEDHPCAVLTEDIVRDAKARIENGETNAAIARALNINNGSVSMIRSGKQWAHVAP